MAMGCRDEEFGALGEHKSHCPKLGCELAENHDTFHQMCCDDVET
jgi:hypothetical protein